MSEINHPLHYGGANNPFEAINVIEAWHLNFHLGNVIKYICRAGLKDGYINDLKKARWYLDREISRQGTGAAGLDIQQTVPDVNGLSSEKDDSPTPEEQI